MAPEVQVRRAKLSDAQVIADFVNSSRSGNPITSLKVADRFSQVGFLIAEQSEDVVGLLGWQVENLVIRVTDFLIAPAIDRVVAGSVLIEQMEEEGQELQAEASILFLPPNPSEELIAYWELFGYEYKNVQELHRAWQDAVAEWSRAVQAVMLKRLREDLIRRPI